MGSQSGGVERWANRQKDKALHVGTYEAAIENMFRCMDDQGGSADRYFMYRAQLSPNCVIEPGVHQEPTDFVALSRWRREKVGPPFLQIGGISRYSPSSVRMGQRERAGSWLIHATAVCRRLE